MEQFGVKSLLYQLKSLGVCLVFLKTAKHGKKNLNLKINWSLEYFIGTRSIAVNVELVSQLF